MGINLDHLAERGRQVAADPVHRCGNCRFRRGVRCHRQPPVPRAGSDGHEAVWPIVADADWCGQYDRLYQS